jgi:uncharacterized protein YndB with AHSA1/START domain
MTERSVTHATFTIERTYDAPPERVFNAWSTVGAKSRWFKGPPDWDEEPLELDFRIGGRERSVGGPKGGQVSTYEAIYWDIVPNERIVSTYEMRLDDARISVSLGTLELEPAGDGTKLMYTEQGAFLDGYDDAGQRELGTAIILDQLGEVLRSEAANA